VVPRAGLDLVPFGTGSLCFLPQPGGFSGAIRESHCRLGGDAVFVQGLESVSSIVRLCMHR
jgi:hypothetical protein